MTEKFTEEEYQKIVDVADKYPNFGQEYIIPNGGEGEWSTTDEELIKAIFGSFYNPENNLLKVQYMIALANPITREWAYDKFVEKEKKYYWSSKKKNKQGKSLVLFHGAGGVVQMLGTEIPLTESEIKEWGFNPEMFDKKEVS